MSTHTVLVRDCWACHASTAEGPVCQHCGAGNPWGQQSMEPDSAHEAREKTTREVSTLKVGSTIWVFDNNRRKYTAPHKGQLWTGSEIIYRAHWAPQIITGETSRSWIIGPWSKKAPKKGPHPGFAYSKSEVDDDCWLHEHRYKLVQHIERTATAATLRKIAALTGFKP